MFPPAKKTDHKNKSYKFAQGGAVPEAYVGDKSLDDQLKRIRGFPEDKKSYTHHDIDTRVDSARGVPIARGIAGAGGESGRIFRNPFRSQESKTIDAIDDPVRAGRNEADRADIAAGGMRERVQISRAQDEMDAEKKRKALVATPPMARAPAPAPRDEGVQANIKPTEEWRRERQKREEEEKRRGIQAPLRR